MGKNIGQVKVNLQVHKEVPINRRSSQEYTKIFGSESIDATEKQAGFLATNFEINPDPITGITIGRRFIRKPNFLIASSGNIYTTSITGATDSSGNNILDSVEFLHYAWKPDTPWYRQTYDNLDPDIQYQKFARSEINTFGQIWENASIDETASEPPTFGVFNTPPIRLNAPYQKKSRNGDIAPKFLGTEIKGGIHWGLKKHKPVPANQPFFIEFYGGGKHKGGLNSEQIGQVESQCTNSRVKQFSTFSPNGDGKSVGLNMADSVYYVVNLTGKTFGEEYYLVIEPSRNPTLYLKTYHLDANDTDERGTLVIGESLIPISTYSHPSIDLLENGSDSGLGLLRLEFTTVAGRLIIRNNVFDEPWIITRSDLVIDSSGTITGSDNAPIIYQGNLRIYGGNRTVKINFGYIRYYEQCKIITPEIPFAALEEDITNAVTATIELKAEDKNSQRSKSKKSSSKKRSAKRGYMADTDSIDGESLSPRKETSPPGDTDISIALANGYPVTEPFTSNFKWEITLTSSNTNTGDGYTIINGRAPTLWGIRFFVEAGEPGSNSLIANLSNDVMSISESYSSPSYQLIEHTMDVVVQNNKTLEYTPQYDYETFIDRVHFVKMQVGFINGVGDPFDETKFNFTGLMYGGTKTRSSPSLETVTLKCSDPMIILDHTLMLNSPIYDGMASVKVIEDMAIRAGFSSYDTTADALKVFLDSKSQLSMPLTANFTQPRFRIEDRTPMKEAMLRVAKRDWAVLYCDGDGHLHYADLAGGISGDEAEAARSVKKEFFVNIIDANGDETKVMNKEYSITRSALDAFNSIYIQTVDQNSLDIIMVGDTNFDSIYNSNASGYMGFKKPFLISETALGSPEAARAYLEELKRLYIPPVELTFSTWGIAGLKSLDIIKVNGQLARIISISNTINKESNEFSSSITAEWIFASPNASDLPN